MATPLRRAPVRLFLLSSVSLFCQDPRGTVPGSAIVATHAGTGVRTTATRNAQGAYDLLYLAPGAHSTRVEKDGFKSWTQQAVTVRSGDRLRLDVKLEVGSITKAITVTSAVSVPMACKRSISPSSRTSRSASPSVSNSVAKPNAP